MSCCQNHADHGHTQDTKTAIDPVCGMKVDPGRTPHHATHGGTDYHFCAARCRERQ